MSDSKKYYYMKLKEDFYEREEIKLIEAMPDGYKYVSILLKLYLRSLKSEGRLMYKDTIPYNSQMLATILNHSVGDVTAAIEIFKQMGLIDVLDTGAIYMLDIQNFIGKSSSEADRVRKFRNQIATEKTPQISESVQMYDKRTPEREIELEIEKEIELEIELDKPKPKKTKRFVEPTVEEVEKYCTERSNGINANKFIDYYSARGWELGKGRKMKDWKACIRTWEQNDKEKRTPKELVYDNDNGGCDFFCKSIIL